MNGYHPLAKLSAATYALAEASTLDELKQIMDIAELAKAYVRAAKLGLEAQNRAATLKLRAERKAGELLQAMKKAQGGQPYQEKSTGCIVQPVEKKIPTLAEVGIEKTQAMRWQQIAKLPEELFEEHIAAVIAKQGEVTTQGVVDLARERKYADQRSYKKEVAQTLPDGVYNVIYADPPWEFSNTGVHGAAHHHYDTLTIEQVATYLEDNNIQVAQDAVLFLWIPNPLIFEVARSYLIERWGFENKTNMAWVKTELKKAGIGYYVRGRHELLFICAKGSFRPLDDVAPPIGSVVDDEDDEGVVYAPIQEHSRKPLVFYELIERLYPGCNYLELFGTSQRARWVTIGYQRSKYALEASHSQRQA